jgi:hypothetical protein
MHIHDFYTSILICIKTILLMEVKGNFLNVEYSQAKKEHFRLFGFTSTINICRFVLILAIKFNEGTCNDFDVLHPPFNNLSRGLKSKNPTQK